MSDWELIGSESVVESPWMRVRRNRYRLPDGREIDDYFVVERSAFVLVVALRAGRLVLVRQYRPATGREYVSLPAGYIDEAESPEEAARRELREETGLEATQFRLIGQLDPLPGYLSSKAFVVLCEEAAGELRVGDADEISQVFDLPIDEAVGMIRSGGICEMQAVSAILLTLAQVDL